VPPPKPVFERRGAYSPLPPDEPPLAQPPLDPDFAARFGPYAGVAQAERGIYSGAGLTDALHANSNTRSQGLAEAPLPVPPAASEAPNVVPFKQQPAGPRAFGEELPAENDELRMPNIIARGQSALAARIEPEILPEGEARGVTVTATERRFSFELPLDDQRVTHGLYGIAGLLRQAAPAAEPAPAGPDAATRPADENAAAPEARNEAPAAAVWPVANAERAGALSLPAPIREQEGRG
jgi:hypothetical protein